MRKKDKRIELNHVSDSGRPQMVDVSDKSPTLRHASAVALVRFPKAVAKQLRSAGMRGKKGPILDTAIVAGVMAAKRTHELIPFCHPLAIERCDIQAEFVDEVELRIRCDTAITGKTGVEMEALTGATVAALTIYDMCKALSHEIVIGQIRLVEKSGGRRTIRKGKVGS
jgi:cyclic pyranopterin monophosphate synthase